MGARLLKQIGEFLAGMPGLLTLVAIGLVVLNLVFQFLPGDWPIIGWLAQTNLLLHIGLIIGLLGELLNDAL